MTAAGLSGCPSTAALARLLRLINACERPESRDTSHSAPAYAPLAVASSTSSCRSCSLAALARAFGGHGETVLETADFEPAWHRAVASGLPAILDIAMDPEALTVSAATQQSWPACCGIASLGRSACCARVRCAAQAGGMTLTKMREDAEAATQKQSARDVSRR